MEILAARRAAKKFDLFLLDFYLWVKQHVPVKLCIHTYARAARRGTVTSVSIADTLTDRVAPRVGADFKQPGKIDNLLESTWVKNE